MASSSESERDVVWKRREQPRKEEEDREFWATPPRKRKEETEERSTKQPAKQCLVSSCSIPVKNNARHTKHYHMPSFVEETIDRKIVKKWMEFLRLICTLLGLTTLENLVELVNRKSLHSKITIAMSPRDKDVMNCVAKELQEDVINDTCLKQISKKCQLTHWSVVVRIVNYMTSEQRFALFAKFPTVEAMKAVLAKNFVIVGDSIVRYLGENLEFDVPVICAPGVCMCNPDRDKWILRLWVPVLEMMLSRPKPHFIFHLGTNNISNLGKDSPAIIRKDALELCKKLWKFNRSLNITFSAILYRSDKDQPIVMEANHKLRQLAESDDRINFVDFSNVLRDRKLFRRDQVHLSEEGVNEFAKCFNDYLYRKYK